MLFDLAMHSQISLFDFVANQLSLPDRLSEELVNFPQLATCENFILKELQQVDEQLLKDHDNGQVHGQSCEVLIRNNSAMHLGT